MSLFTLLQIPKELIDDPKLLHNHPSQHPSVYEEYVSVYPPRKPIYISHPQPKDEFIQNLAVYGAAQQCSLLLQVIPKSAHKVSPHGNAPSGKFVYFID